MRPATEPRRQRPALFEEECDVSWPAVYYDETSDGRHEGIQVCGLGFHTHESNDNYSGMRSQGSSKPAVADFLGHLHLLFRYVLLESGQWWREVAAVLSSGRH